MPQFSPTFSTAFPSDPSPKSAAVTHAPGAPARTAVSPLMLPSGAAANRPHDVRRPSIQFLPHSTAGLPTAKQNLRRRMSSPPPPPLFQPRVSFDTFEKQTELTSFSLITKHKDYEYTKRSRTFLCGLDSNEYSDAALEWLIDELVDDGDEVVCLRVVEKDSNIAGPSSVEQGRYRQEAETIMEKVQSKNHENKAVNLVLEFAVGKVPEVIDEMIKLYEPAILIVGTKGRSLGGFQGLLPGSISKYCLQHSPVPVIVVRPNNQRKRQKNKRQLDPLRQGYRDILDKSGSGGGHMLDRSNRSSMILEDVEISDAGAAAEAAAVAEAVGFKDSTNNKGSPLTQVYNAVPDDMAEDSRIPARIMKSPELGNLETPELSEASSDEEDEIQGGVSTAAQMVQSPDAIEREEFKSPLSSPQTDAVTSGVSQLNVDDRVAAQKEAPSTGNQQQRSTV